MAWTPVFVSYGSMPSTLAPSPGTVVDVWVTWLDEEAIQVFDGTEHANPSERPLYVNSTIKGADYQFEGPDPDSMRVFLSCFGPLTIDESTHNELVTHVQKGGDLRHGSSTEASEFTRRTGEMFQMIASTAEFQFE